MAEPALLVAVGALVGGAAVLQRERREHRPSKPIELEPLIRGRLLAAQKRVCDIVASALFLVVLALVIALIALCVAIDSPGPIFYRAGRVAETAGRWRC